MRILHLIYTNGIAGAEKYLKHLLPSLKMHGMDCHLMMVCSPGYEQPLQQYADSYAGSGIPVKLIISTKSRFIQTAFAVNRYLKENDIEYVHSHLLNSDVIATLVKVLFNKKVVLISTKHGYAENILKQFPNPENIARLKKEDAGTFYHRVTKYVIKKSSYNVAVSRAIADLYTGLGLTERNMPFIHHGITIDKLKTGPGNKYRKSDKQLVIVGRLEEFKGHRFLIEALPQVIAVFPETILLVIGIGSEKESLEKLIIDLNIQPHVIFMGFNSDPYSFVLNSDVIILPSLFEPFGLVYIEAFALGTAVVAFDTPAGNEIITNDKTGLLVPARDVARLAEKIIWLLKHPEQARAIADRAYTEYQLKFTTERMVSETAEFYRSIAN